MGQSGQSTLPIADSVAIFRGHVWVNRDEFEDHYKKPSIYWAFLSLSSWVISGIRAFKHGDGANLATLITGGFVTSLCVVLVVDVVRGPGSVARGRRGVPHLVPVLRGVGADVRLACRGARENVRPIRLRLGYSGGELLTLLTRPRLHSKNTFEISTSTMHCTRRFASQGNFLRC